MDQNEDNRMKNSPFDTFIDRRQSASIKWQKFHEDVIPMWVADMEFATPKVITDALKERIDHPIFGYTAAPETLVSAVTEYCTTRHHWTIDSNCIVWVPGVLPALTAACQAVAKKGISAKENEIIVFPPVYHPLLEIPEKLGQTRVDVPMTYDNGKWSLNFELLEASITDKTVAILLSSPHNPMGMMFTAEDLYRLSSLCTERKIVLISDEIHCDLILHEDKKHIPTALAAAEHHQSVITIMSPSKTFNVAGANCSFAHITDPELLKKFKHECHYTVPLVPTLSYTVAEAAYAKGWQWHSELIDYLRGNHDYLHSAINDIEGLSMDRIDATYLAWIDTRHLTKNLNLEDTNAFFANAGVGLSPGSQFGESNYQRLNFACSRKQLEEGIERIRDAIAKSS